MVPPSGIWYGTKNFLVRVVLTFMAGAAVQLVCAARILLLRHRPCVSGYDELVQQQGVIQRCAETICGIASALVDDDSVPTSPQCLFIGMRSSLLIFLNQS